MDEILPLERTGGVVVATLSRPPVNALDDELIARLEAVVDHILGDEEATVLHVRSALKVFCAGADLAAMHACMASPARPDAMLALVRRMQRLFARMETAPVVTVAEIGGSASCSGRGRAIRWRRGPAR